MAYLTKTLSLLLVTGMFYAIYITASTHEAPELYPNNGGAQSVIVKQQRENLPVNVPVWEKSDRKFGCQPESFAGFSHLLIVDQKNERIVMEYDEADRRIHNDEKADDVWVVGFC